MDPASQQTVGVIVPVRNGERYLSQTLAAVEAQTHAEWVGIVMVNDSNDRTAEIAEEHAAADARWQVLHATEAGVSRARNAGRAALQRRLGDRLGYVWWLDADDLPREDLAEKLIATLQQHPNSPAAHAAVSFIDGDDADVALDDVLRARLVRRVRSGRQLRELRTDEPTTRAALATWPCVVTPGVVLARASAVAELAWNTQLPIGEDTEFWFRVARRGGLAYVDEPLLRYRLHAGSAGQSSSRARRRLAAVRALIAACGDADERRSVRRSYRLMQRRLGRQRLAEAARLAARGRVLPSGKRASNAAVNLVLGTVPVV